MMLRITEYEMRIPIPQLTEDLTQKGSEYNTKNSKLWNHRTIMVKTANDLGHSHIFRHNNETLLPLCATSLT